MYILAPSTSCTPSLNPKPISKQGHKISGHNLVKALDGPVVLGVTAGRENVGEHPGCEAVPWRMSFFWDCFFVGLRSVKAWPRLGLETFV